MENAIYVGLSQQMALQRHLEVVANNVANMSTTAFKTDSVVFSEYLASVESTDPAIGGTLSLVQDLGLARDTGAGELRLTGNPLDVAIKGKGFFTIMGADGVVRYTRNGHFEINNEGTLVTAAGHPVLDDTGNTVTLSPEDTDLSIANDGTISAPSGAGGRLGVVEFLDEQIMEKRGDGLLETQEVALPAANAEIKQGMLEDSNVQPIIEMTKLIELMRSYQTSSELMGDYQELMRRAVQKLGSFS